jgi:hypothetical protein
VLTVRSSLATLSSRRPRPLVVGAAHRPIHVLVFFLSHGLAPRFAWLLGNTMTASAGESTPPGPPFASVHGRQFQLIKALFPAIALRRHLGETGLERYLPAITLRCHFCKLVLKHHQHLFGDSDKVKSAPTLNEIRERMATKWSGGMKTIPFKPRDPETRTDVNVIIGWPMKRLTY